MRRLWAGHDLAQKLGQELGQRAVLQRPLPGGQIHATPAPGPAPDRTLNERHNNRPQRAHIKHAGPACP